mmetsp:Transcript_122771/g.382224  ORF Transcript_122771/g.382224 Transcript_122771/m.382224 type:complete len:320 (-) Transcript_122771:170-1129(-)
MAESDAGSVILHGDTSRRVTVPLPLSLPELQYHANRHFARDRTGARMFHHGEKHVHHSHHMGGIKDGDVIIIEKLPKSVPEAPNLTMNQTDYVKHDIEARPPPLMREPPPPGAKFDGVSSYKVDYVKHPLGFREPVQPPRSGFLTGRPDGKTGKSMYTEHYPWREPEPRQAAQPPSGVPLTTAPFHGVTSYTNDYIKHPVRPRSAAPTTKPRGVPLPFEATTTYNNDYQNVPNAPTVPAKPLKATLVPDGSPFEGASEYKREYVELKTERRPIVHLEPEIRREPRLTAQATPRGRSTPRGHSTPSSHSTPKAARARILS